MLVLQYKCRECSSFFEHLYGATDEEQVNCMACGSGNVFQSSEVPFYPNKNFCPHDKELDPDVLKDTLKTIMGDRSEQCGGCGVDGAPGKCKSGGCGGGCSSGGCSSGGCGGKK